MKKTYRLSNDVKPSRYAITITPDLENFTFFGEETITLHLKKKLKKIILHSADLSLSNVTITEKKENLKAKISYNPKAETVTLTFPKTLSTGQKKLFIQFNGVLSDQMRGFYRSRYEVDGKSQYMAVSQFESTDARRAFPCIDEPSAKAIFDVTLKIPQNTTAISNTIADVVTEHKEGYKIVQFTPTPIMSTYLLAFVVGQFEFIEKKTKEGILVRIFTTPGKKKQAEFALDVAAKLLTFFNEYFAIDYPISVLDLIAIPDFAAGAMENWGAVTFREAALLIDEDHSSSANKQMVAVVVAHELAHMWFGNLATMEWWTHLWLNEGFATYIEYVAVDSLFPQWDLWSQFIAVDHNGALALDSLKSTHPIEVRVNNPNEINEIFDQVSYAKGSSVLYMLATYLGPDDFREGLRLYLKTFAYKNASTEDLWDAFEKTSKKNIRKIMQNWTQQAGYPVIIVKEKKDTLHILQQRFFSNPIAAKKTKSKTLWNIPLPVAHSHFKEKNMLVLTKREDVIPKPLSSEWIKINSGESSFVRVAYPHSMIENLEKAIINHAFPAIDRLGLIRDAFDLAFAEYTSTVDALDLLTSYTAEESYVVWLEVIVQLLKLENLISSDDSMLPLYNEYRKHILSKIAQKIGWEQKKDEAHSKTLLRSLVLSAYGRAGDSNTIKKAKEHFSLFTKSKIDVDPEIRNIVYGLNCQYGDQTVFDIFKKRYKDEELNQEKDRVARGLTLFEDPAILQQVLMWAVSPDVRPQDFPRIMYGLFINPKASEMTWEFLENHWDELFKKYSGSHSFSRIIEGAKEFNTHKMAKRIKQFFVLHPAPELSRTIRQVVEQIEANADWKRRELKNVKTFLKNFKKS